MRTILLCASVLLFGTVAYGQSQPKCLVSIADMMSAKEFEAAGLDTLTPQQLAALNTWLSAHPRRLDEEAGEDVIETRIDGDFDGWEGQTRFTLQNGQVWQQAGPGAKYYFANAPRVVISRASYKMKVEGMTGEIAVRRVK